MLITSSKSCSVRVMHALPLQYSESSLSLVAVSHCACASALASSNSRIASLSASIQCSNRLVDSNINRLPHNSKIRSSAAVAKRSTAGIGHLRESVLSKSAAMEAGFAAAESSLNQHYKDIAEVYFQGET